MTVAVSDEGIGMKEDEVNRVFDGFLSRRNQLSQSLNPYGNGIGLSFCKEICQNLDGNIHATSTLGVGSVFTFTMGVNKSYGVVDRRPHIDNSEDS